MRSLCKDRNKLSHGVAQVWTEEYGYGKIPYGWNHGEWVHVTINLKNIASHSCSSELTL